MAKGHHDSLIVQLSELANKQKVDTTRIKIEADQSIIEALDFIEKNSKQLAGIEPTFFFLKYLIEPNTKTILKFYDELKSVSNGANDEDEQK